MRDVLHIKLIHGWYNNTTRDANFGWQLFTCQRFVAYKREKDVSRLYVLYKVLYKIRR